VWLAESRNKKLKHLEGSLGRRHLAAGPSSGG
jgi:hypothetical protein